MKKDMRDTIVDNIEIILQRKNLSQKELANKISMADVTLGKVLHKKMAITTDEVDKIAKALDVPAHMLYTPIPLGYKGALPLFVQVKTKESEETIQKLSTLAQRILFYKNLRANTEKQMRITR
jgi:transcriptional regulator with XRE-family HTH domain